ncbi:MAG: 4'-phosphopantetheinyl transferase superfamily protein [Oscillatoria princeps RMCB-10]|nr:4'-phosphopantetheinyl transferase superfamily protein [Oscillatoria princeps RMCB-10]
MHPEPVVQEIVLWHPPPASLTLSLDEVHIWRASLDLPAELLAQLRATLSADEQRRADRFYFERDRHRFTAGRGILRNILSRYSGIEPALLEFGYSPRGKPALRSDSAGGNLNFNLSHSGGIALYAVTRHRLLGIDLEMLRPMPDAEKIAERFFSPLESAVLRNLPATDKQEAFFLCWTRKEAYLKAVGEGLTGLDDVEVSLTPGEPAKVLSISGGVQDASRWSLQHLTPAPDCVGAVAVEGHGFSLSCWEWEFDTLGCQIG